MAEKKQIGFRMESTHDGQVLCQVWYSDGQEFVGQEQPVPGWYFQASEGAAIEGPFPTHNKAVAHAYELFVAELDDEE